MATLTTYSFVFFNVNRYGVVGFRNQNFVYHLCFFLNHTRSVDRWGYVNIVATSVRSDSKPDGEFGGIWGYISIGKDLLESTW